MCWNEIGNGKGKEARIGYGNGNVNYKNTTTVTGKRNGHRYCSLTTDRLKNRVDGNNEERKTRTC